MCSQLLWSGKTCPEPEAGPPLAEWNRARDVWETHHGTMFCQHWDAFSGTWPRAGSMRSGRVYEHQTLAAATSESESSCWPGSGLLPTPTSHQHYGSSAGYGLSLFEAVTSQTRLLPTPAARDGEHANGAYRPERVAAGHTLTLPDLAVGLKQGPALLPTPMAADGQHGLSLTIGRSPEMATSLATRAVFADFGEYAPAIARHTRLLGRPAPTATEPNRNGNPRLSPRFVEWMMCLPEGYVTDTPGLSPRQAITALGNGVVPVQAYTALLWMARLMLAAVFPQMRTTTVGSS